MNLNETKAQVMDLLNQIVLLTKEVKDVPTFEDYDYTTRPVTTSQLDYGDQDEILNQVGVTKEQLPELDTQAYLRAVGDYAKRVVDGKESSATYNEVKYYTSACY